MNSIYWISTTIISVFLAVSSYSYFFSKQTIEGVRALGFPDFFRIELAILKIIAIFILLIPTVSIQVKEWAYAGVGLFLLTALVAHIAHKDSIFITILLIILFAVLTISNIYLAKLRM